MFLAAVALAVLVVTTGAGVVYVRRQSSAGQPLLPFGSVGTRSAPARTLAAQLHISPAHDGIMICGNSGSGGASAAAWSPDGQSIAVLGYAGKCSQNDPVSYAYQPGVVGIYSATTGALISQLNPDPAITAALRLKAPQLPVLSGIDTSQRGDTRHQIISYGSVLWSPDGKQLMIFGQASSSTSNPPPIPFITVWKVA